MLTGKIGLQSAYFFSKPTPEISDGKRRLFGIPLTIRSLFVSERKTENKFDEILTQFYKQDKVKKNQQTYKQKFYEQITALFDKLDFYYFQVKKLQLEKYLIVEFFVSRIFKEL